MSLSSSNSSFEKKFRKLHTKKLHKIKRITKIDSSNSSSRSRRNTRHKKKMSNNKNMKRVTSIDSLNTESKIRSSDYVAKTRKTLYNKARTIKRRRRICYQAISKMSKAELIRFLRKHS